MPVTPYLKDRDGHLRPLDRFHCQDEETELQDLLASNPDVLPGEQINPEDPRRWLVIAREVPIPDPGTGHARWSMDLFLTDQDAIPTLVEVKRFQDTRARREVFGQMLEYAANGPFYWTAGQLRGWAEALAQERGRDLATEITPLQPEETPTPEDYFDRAMTHLANGRLRIVFLLKEGPPELKSLVDFLNSQMERTEVLLVKAGHYRLKGMDIVIPQLFGYSNQAFRAKRREPGTPSQRRQWEWASFEEDDRNRGLHPETLQAMSKLLVRCRDSALCGSSTRGMDSS